MLNEGLLKSLTLLHSQPLGMRQRLLRQRLKQCVWLTSDKHAEMPQSIKVSCAMEEVMAQNDLRFPRTKIPPDVWLWCLIPHLFFYSTEFAQSPIFFNTRAHFKLRNSIGAISDEYSVPKNIDCTQCFVDMVTQKIVSNSDFYQSVMFF